MTSIPKRFHSTTRLDRRSNGLSIYYKRGNDDIEEEMMRVTVVRSGEKHDDTLRSSKSSKSSKSDSMITSSGKSEKKNKKTKSKRKDSTSSKKSRTMNFVKKWRKFKGKRQHNKDCMDEDTARVLNDLKTLNYKIRTRFHIGPSPSYVNGMKVLNENKKNNLSIPSDSSETKSLSLETAQTISTVSNPNSPVLTAEAFDYRGQPLKHPLTLTPFISTRSAKTHQKVESDKIKKDELIFVKPPVPPVSCPSAFSDSSEMSTTSTTKNENEESEVEESPVRLTRVSSGTRFPGARSPGTREKLRLLLKENAIKKQQRECETAELNSKEDAKLATALKSMISEKDKEKKEKASKGNKIKKEKSSSSLKTLYSKSELTIGCKSCSSCVGCVSFCEEKHSKKENKKKGNQTSRKKVIPGILLESVPRNPLYAVSRTISSSRESSFEASSKSNKSNKSRNMKTELF